LAQAIRARSMSLRLVVAGAPPPQHGQQRVRRGDVTKQKARPAAFHDQHAATSARTSPRVVPVQAAQAFCLAGAFIQAGRRRHGARVRWRRRVSGGAFGRYSTFGSGRPPQLQRPSSSSTHIHVAATTLLGEVGGATEIEGARTEAPQPDLQCGDWLRFHHVHFFVDELRPLAEYKVTEKHLNVLAASLGEPRHGSREAARKRWEEIAGSSLHGEFLPTGRDMVNQLMHGAGWRITAKAEGEGTRSLLLSSPDPQGVRFLVTAPCADAQPPGPTFEHLAAHHLDRFFERKLNRQGVAVLGFEVEAGRNVLETIAERYARRHPRLLVRTGASQILEHGDGTRVLDVFAYYQAPGGAETSASKEADVATLLRFVERPRGVSALPPLPGLELVDAVFPCDSAGCAAYADHWVSNVVDRVEFLQTLEETLGFTPKVDFNAGVVAAGEAVIESTVTGNQPVGPLRREDLLTNQQQVYLPINNPLSSVGHVHLYVEQLGQGVQHLASRVPDLVSFVERANWYREVTDEGLAFLKIPRSYYGTLVLADLEATGLDPLAAKAALGKLQAARHVDSKGIVALDLDEVALSEAMAGVPPETREAAMQAVRHSRYKNLYSFLQDRLSEEEYLRVVRSQVLVDVQGRDVLYQIFTAPVLQRDAAEEAPFLEFIQRRCSSTGPVRSGCGGFGIRNFLTLFLSIEVSKAMDARDAAAAIGDAAAERRASRAIDIFASQLEASNPILTQIGDAMRAEAEALDAAAASPEGSQEKAKQLERAQEFRRAKESGQRSLVQISAEHKDQMAALRAAAAAS